MDIEILGYFNNGILNIGILNIDILNIGILNFGILKFWDIEILGYSNIGILEYWEIYISRKLVPEFHTKSINIQNQKSNQLLSDPQYGFSSKEAFIF